MTPGTLMNHDNFQLGLDFDDTLFLNAYPAVGWEVPGALDALGALARDHKVEFILITLRTGRPLRSAVDHLKLTKGPGLPLVAVNDNPVQRMWEAWRDAGRAAKIHVDALVDDRAVGTPLTEFEGREVVDWEKVEPMLRERMRGWKR